MTNKEEVKKLNAAQVLQDFIWENKLEKFKLSIDNEISINQSDLLKYLMKFQDFVFKYDHK